MARPSRRTLLSGLALTALVGRRAMAQSLIGQTPPLPNPDIFEAGDLLWTKKPGVFVPYSQDLTVDLRRDQQIWETEKENFLDRARAGNTELSPQQIAEIQALTYREFLARYEGDQKPDQPGVYSSGAGIYVGHVGIINFSTSGQPEV